MSKTTRTSGYEVRESYLGRTVTLVVVGSGREAEAVIRNRKAVTMTGTTWAVHYID